MVRSKTPVREIARNQIELIPRSPSKPAPGCVHIPDWLPVEQQSDLIRLIRSKTSGGWYNPEKADGRELGYQVACLGYQWHPDAYIKPRCEIPGEVILLAISALESAGLTEYLPFNPDTGIVSYLAPGATQRLSQADAESSEVIDSGSPIVILSLGDIAVFRLGNCQVPDLPYQDTELRSGDLMIISGHFRRAYHGIVDVIPGTSPELSGVSKPGTVILSVRQVFSPHRKS